MSDTSELASMLERKRDLEQLLDSRGWKNLVLLGQAQVDQLQREILFTPCASLDSAITHEYKKGQLEGRLAMSELAATEVEIYEARILHLRKVAESDGRSYNASGDGSGDAANPGGRAP